MKQRRRKRGLLWWLIFVVAFAVTSYLVRNREDRPPLSRESSEPRGIAGQHLAQPDAQSLTVGAKEQGATEAEDRSEAASFLAELNRDRWQSPAGLVYSPIDSSQHRLGQLATQVCPPADQQKQRGFYGDLRQVLVWIDQAYRRSRQGTSEGKILESSEGESVIRIEMPEAMGWVRQSDSVNIVSTSWIQVTLREREVIDASPILSPTQPTE